MLSVVLVLGVLSFPGFAEEGMTTRTAGAVVRCQHPDRDLADRAVQALSVARRRIEEAFDRQLLPVTIRLAAPPKLSHPRAYYASASEVWLSPRALRRIGQRNLENVLTHELTHTCLYQAAGEKWCHKQPYWFTVGLATFVGSGHRDLSLLSAAFHADRLPSLRALSEPWWERSTSFERTAYQCGHTIFEFIVHQHGSEVLKRIPLALSQGKRADAILLETTGMTYRQLEDGWRRFLCQRFGPR